MNSCAEIISETASALPGTGCSMHVGMQETPSARLHRGHPPLVGMLPASQRGCQTTREPHMNAIQLLKDDHKKVRGLLADLESTTRRAAKKRADLLATITREIEIHTRI